MVQKVLAVYDEKARAFLRPIFVSSEGIGIRAFADGVTDEKSNFCKHYMDYSIYRIGEFDEEKGVLVNLAVNELLHRGIEFKIPNVQTEPIKEV